MDSALSLYEEIKVFSPLRFIGVNLGKLYALNSDLGKKMKEPDIEKMQERMCAYCEVKFKMSEKEMMDHSARCLRTSQ